MVLARPEMTELCNMVFSPNFQPTKSTKNFFDLIESSSEGKQLHTIQRQQKKLSMQWIFIKFGVQQYDNLKLINY